jgi:hypothetical protein
MLEQFTLGDNARTESGGAPSSVGTDILPFDIRRKAMRVALGGGGATAATSDKSAQLVDFELWAPGCTKEHASLRPLYFPATDCFIIVFSITQPRALDTIRHVWHQEVREHQECTPHRPSPVLLVGNHAEERHSRSGRRGVASELVLPEEAIELARSCGMLKYVEIQSYHPAHIHEVFRQAALAVAAARDAAGAWQEGGGGGGGALDAEYHRESRIFRSVLGAPEPVGTFDPWERSFRLEARAGMQYLVTWDGTAPTEHSQRYTGKLVMRAPFPYEIQVVPVARCKYRGRARRFEVPPEAVMPQGHFDVVMNQLVLAPGEEGEAAEVEGPDRSGDVTYHYTLDGSEPGPQSAASADGRIDLCVCLAVLLCSGSCCTATAHGVTDSLRAPPRLSASRRTQPQLVRVVAVRDGALRSPTASFQLPPVLPKPRVKVSGQRMSIEQKPGLLYRYTTDGTDPSHMHGKLYREPVTFSSPFPPSIKCAAASSVVGCQQLGQPVLWPRPMGVGGGGAALLSHTPPPPQRRGLLTVSGMQGDCAAQPSPSIGCAGAHARRSARRLSSHTYLGSHRAAAPPITQCTRHLHGPTGPFHPLMKRCRRQSHRARRRRPHDAHSDEPYGGDVHLGSYSVQWPSNDLAARPTDCLTARLPDCQI